MITRWHTLVHSPEIVGIIKLDGMYLWDVSWPGEFPKTGRAATFDEALASITKVRLER